MSLLVTRELCAQTWDDFVDLFTRGNGWDFCWCMAFHRERTIVGKDVRTRKEAGVRNRRMKRRLVDEGRTRGILVYADDVPVGWCQFGHASDLPLGVYRRKLVPTETDEASERAWRITCFVVDKRFRRRGVATAALREALDAIRRHGGGTIEAYPRTGDATASWLYHGTPSMFRRVGFDEVGPTGGGSVIMRKRVRAKRGG